MMEMEHELVGRNLEEIRELSKNYVLPEDACASDVLICAQLHEASADGFMARDTRPGLLREGILARIPAPR